MKTISLIVIMARNRIIGKQNKMPWHYRADLKRFKAITMGKSVIMGRLTYESIGKPLMGRKNIVLSHRSDIKLAKEVCLVHSLNEAIEQCKHDTNEIMVIGGAQLYQLFIPMARRIYLTVIDHDYDGDTYFPAFKKEEWEEIKREDCPSDPLHHYPYSFINLTRRTV